MDGVVFPLSPSPVGRSTIPTASETQQPAFTGGDISNASLMNRKTADLIRHVKSHDIAPQNNPLHSVEQGQTEATQAAAKPLIADTQTSSSLTSCHNSSASLVKRGFSPSILEDGEISGEMHVAKRRRGASWLESNNHGEQKQLPLGGTESHAVAATKSYLEGLLRSYVLSFELRPDLSNSQRHTTQTLIVTGVGIVMAVDAKKVNKVPILPLPQISEFQSETTPKQDQIFHGSFLEDVWSTLSPHMKHNYVRQMRDILTRLHGRSRKKKCKSRIGSPIIGEYSLVLDKHRSKTYWDILKQPTMADFATFLRSSTLPSVPEPVLSSLTSGLGTETPVRFCHGEISPKNIIVHDGKIQYITGWDCAG